MHADIFIVLLYCQSLPLLYLKKRFMTSMYAKMSDYVAGINLDLHGEQLTMPLICHLTNIDEIN